MIKRNQPAVLRFSKTNKDNNPKRYHMNELMLYRPIQQEIDMDQAKAMYSESETYDGKPNLISLT